MGSVAEDTGRFEKLVDLLGISEDKLTSEQTLALKGLLHEFSDAFALSDQELGCTDIVRHYRYWGE